MDVIVSNMAASMTALDPRNHFQNLPDPSPSLEQMPTVITLAMEAIGEPNPPALTPANRLCQSDVNGCSITVAGTLLTSWLSIADAMAGSSSINPVMNSRTESTDDMFPTKTNRSTNVSKSE